MGDRLALSFEDMGEQALKNIARPVRAYSVGWDGRLAGGAPGPAPTLATPIKPSVAVLPFANMSSDPEQEYFADGVVEDIITALSRFKTFAVVARNSSFVYKGRAIDLRVAARELGVRYVLEGSIQRRDKQLRVTAQLIDAETGTHLWAEDSAAASKTFSTFRTALPTASSGSSSRRSGRPKSSGPAANAPTISTPTTFTCRRCLMSIPSTCRAIVQPYAARTSGRARSRLRARIGACCMGA